MTDETEQPTRIARAWTAYERLTDKKAPMPFTLRREAHQAFYAGASVALHLLRAAKQQSTRKEQREALEAIQAEIAEWSAQFDGYLFDDTTH